MTNTTTSSSKSLSARRVSALLVSMPVWSCAALATADTPTSSNLQVQVQVSPSCVISTQGTPTATCRGMKSPMIDTATELVTNELGEQVEVLVTTINF